MLTVESFEKGMRNIKQADLDMFKYSLWKTVCVLKTTKLGISKKLLGLRKKFDITVT